MLGSTEQCSLGDCDLVTSCNGITHFIENLKLLAMELTKNSSVVFPFSALAHSTGPGAGLPEQNWDKILWNATG